MSASQDGSSSELTVAVLGCGTMGIAILSGILASISEMQDANTKPSVSGTSTPLYETTTTTRLPSRFIACVRRPESVRKLKATFAAHLSAVTITQNDNVASAQKADVVILACKPYMVQEVLSEAGLAAALDGKLLISILAGVTEPQIESTLAAANDQKPVQCRVVRAMPNTASLIRESMTVIGISNPPLDPDTLGLVTWIFKRIGEVVYLPPSTMDVCTSLCGSGPAFFALMLEAAIDGAVAMGLPRAEAQRMAAQTMKGAAGLVLNGDHPALLRDKVSTPGGCTIGGLLVLEEGRVRGTVARAVREATVVASQLGQGVQGVNGTRFPGSQLQ
ncbi:pyrroline-5-carboxylate reductase dimerization-domain-containing protein [Chaetomium tenue]|uniref:Pyrroline-5-carboxylate reductase dimerization-domain-containing protein n=1 Tax=Chaetomium tenue TaxID=1854479 RepID=A0ACB7P1A2_9PEZI|nr:pyrroline-5-carboxylate reductase dimerization-domain-containing protein [Chaetomium globosum]